MICLNIKYKFENLFLIAKLFTIFCLGLIIFFGVLLSTPYKADFYNQELLIEISNGSVSEGQIKITKSTLNYYNISRNDLFWFPIYDIPNNVKKIKVNLKNYTEDFFYKSSKYGLTCNLTKIRILNSNYIKCYVGNNTPKKIIMKITFLSEDYQDVKKYINIQKNTFENGIFYNLSFNFSDSVKKYENIWFSPEIKDFKKLKIYLKVDNCTAPCSFEDNVYNCDSLGFCGDSHIVSSILWTGKIFNIALLNKNKFSKSKILVASEEELFQLVEKDRVDIVLYELLRGFDFMKKQIALLSMATLLLAQMSPAAVGSCSAARLRSIPR